MWTYDRLRTHIGIPPMKRMAQFLFAFLLTAAFASHGLCQEVAQQAREAALVTFDSDEGLARLGKASAKADFPLLANHFESVQRDLLRRRRSSHRFECRPWPKCSGSARSQPSEHRGRGTFRKDSIPPSRDLPRTA
jgi:hypothetical protein